jgi:hypothetical protein
MRRVQLVSLAARERIPAAYSNRDYVEAGGLVAPAHDVGECIAGTSCGVRKGGGAGRQASDCRFSVLTADSVCSI